MFILSPYFYFLIIVNETDSSVIGKVKQYIISYVLLQIPVGIFRFITEGQHEGNAGTLTNDAGSISAILPAVVCAFLFSHYIFQKKNIYIILIICFILFGLIGEKRALFIFIPAVFLISYLIIFLKGKFHVNYSSIRMLSTIIVLVFLTFYSAIRLNPTLNPDDKIGGKFDIGYLIMYSQKYMSSESKSFSEMRRMDSLIYFKTYMLNQSILTMLFGDGPGKLISSKYADSYSNLMLKHYHIRYGGRMGSIWILLQIGYCGLIVYVFMFVNFAKFVWKINNFDSKSLAFILMTIIFFIDIIFYSTVFIRYFFIMGTYMFLFAILYRNKYTDSVLKLKM